MCNYSNTNICITNLFINMIPKYQNLTLPNDNTRVVRQPIYHKIKYTPKPGEFIWTNRDGTKSIVRGKNAQLSQDNRSSKQRKQDQKSAVAIRKQRELKAAEQQTAQVAGEVLNRAMPSTIARAIHDAAKGKNSFVGSMIEGNKGLGNPALNFAFDIVAPIGITKGFKYATNIVPKVARFGVSNHTGNWTQFGNNMYRLKPGYIGMNGIEVERKPISEIFEQERWNRFRNPKYVTEADRVELESHFPEYKTIQERAMDEGNYLIIPANSPLAKMSTQLDDGRLLFTGDEGTWIQSQSQNFKTRQNGATTKVGFKGGTDQKEIEGVVSNHAPETFPNQENGVFFAGPRLYADTYNHGQESPGFWLFFRSPYDMLDGGKKAFPLEDNTVRFVRGVMSSPSYKGGEVPIQTYNTINKAWNAEYLNNPEIVEFLSRDPNKMSPSELIKRDNLLRTIRQGQLSENEVKFNRGVESMVRSGKLYPLRSQYYDGFIGRDHALGWSPRRDFKWPFGSNPETYVIFHPEQAKLLVGNNGAFSSLTPAYSRKKGGKLNRLINKRK